MTGTSVQYVKKIISLNVKRYEVMPELKNIVGSDEMKNSGGSAARRHRSDDNVLAEILGFLKCKYEYTVQLYMQKQPPTLEKCSSVTNHQ